MSWAGRVRKGVGLAVALFVVGAFTAWAEGAAIGPGDWQYRQLDGLAQAGLLSGHPKGSIAEWAGGHLTRFEAASLTLRAVDGIGRAYQEQGRALAEIAQAPAGPAESAPAAMVTYKDLAAVEKLIQEFRTELVTMGVRVDDLGAALKEVQARLARVEADQRKHKLGGYLQMRYRDDDSTEGKQEFLVRRARFNVRGPVSERTTYRLEFQLDAKEAGKGTGSKVQMRSAHVDQKLPVGTLRIGQAKLPWGYELLDSAADLWSGERALFMDRLFPDQRDIGVQWCYRRTPTSPQFDVGIFNGTGINASDNNNRKDILARVDVPLASGSIALSGYLGEDGVGAAATSRNRYGLSIRLQQPDGAQFQGEIVTGQDRGKDVRGWYAQIGRPVSKTAPDLAFVKYDRYDEDADSPNDLFARWSIGYWRDLDAATRLSLVHERRDAEAGFSELSKWDGNATWLQLRVKY